MKARFYDDTLLKADDEASLASVATERQESALDHPPPSSAGLPQPKVSQDDLVRSAILRSNTIRALARDLELRAASLERAGKAEEAAEFRKTAEAKLANACVRILRR